MNTAPLLTAVAVVLAITAFAEDDLPKTLMTQRGNELVAEDLAQMPTDVTRGGGLPSLQHGWRFQPGKWEFVDGALKGTQLEADHHSAGAFFAYRYHDAVIQFDVQLNGCRQALFCVDDPAAPRPPTPTRPAMVSVEHICRVIFTKDGFSTQKDDHDHDGPDQAVPFGTIKMPIEPGVWKTVLVELKGKEMVATIDGRSIAGEHPLIEMEKGYFSFNVTGDSASFRKLRIWEALPNEDWAKNKALLRASQ